MIGDGAHRRHHGGEEDARADPALPSAGARRRSRVDIEPDAALPGLRVTATAKLDGKTGVEMEALTAVAVACLTIYDMAKAVDRGMRSPTSGWRRRPAAAPATGGPRRGMSLLPVDEAVARLLAGVDAAAGRDGAARRCARPRARRRRRRAPDAAALPRFGHGRLRRARRRGDGGRAAQGRRHVARRRALRRRARPRRGGAHLHRRAGSGRRRRHPDPGERRARRRQRSACVEAGRRRAQSSARPGSISAQGDVLLRRGPRSRLRARSRSPLRWATPPSPCAAGRASRSSRTATSSCRPARRPGRTRSSPRTASASPRWCAQAGGEADRPRHRARQARGDRRLRRPRGGRRHSRRRAAARRSASTTSCRRR